MKTHIYKICILLLFSVTSLFAIDKNTFFNEWGKECLKVDVMGLKIGMSRENINEAWSQNELKDRGVDTIYQTQKDAKTQLSTDTYIFSSYTQTNIFKEKSSYIYMQDNSLHKDKGIVTVFYNEDDRAVAIKLVLEKVFEKTKNAILKELDFTYYGKSSADLDKITLSAGAHIKIEVYTPQSGKSGVDTLYTVNIFYYHTEKYPHALKHEESNKYDIKKVL